jgi:radical SAM superfamily enzyme YgiQ (UPF0313 family)
MNNAISAPGHTPRDEFVSVAGHAAGDGSSIVFINCYEKMATGMRILAQIAQDSGYNARICVMHGHSDPKIGVLSHDPDIVHTLGNGRLRVKEFLQRYLSPQELALLQREIREASPVLLCVSSRSRNDFLMPDMLQSVRNAAPGVPVICGGHGPSCSPEYYLRHGATLVIRGEGEEPMRELLRLHRMGLPLESTPNACRLQNGLMVCNPLRPLLRELSPEISPSPLTGDEHVVFIDDNTIERRDPADDDKIFNILLGRGCIGRCAYCAAPVQDRMYKAEGRRGPRYRRRSHEQVLRELEEAKARGMTKILFKDEYLVDRPEVLIDFFTEYAQRIALPFRANFHHAQLLRNEKLLRVVLEAGLFAYNVGFQAGNEDMARKVYRRPHKFAELLALSKILFDEFVGLQIHFISGTNLNSEEEFADKCALIRKLPYDAAFPWRAFLWDFQFLPHPLSQMTADLNVRRLPVEVWAEKALIAQLHQVAPSESMLRGILEEIPVKEAGWERRVEYLQNAYQRMAGARKEWAFREAAEQLAGKDIFVMGEATGAYRQWGHLFGASRVLGCVAFPGASEDEAGAAGRISVQRLVAMDNAPVVVFGDSLERPKAMRRKHKVRNALVCVCSHIPA